MFGESERLLMLTPPWLHDASSPDKTPASSLWQQQRRQTREFNSDLYLFILVLESKPKRIFYLGVYGSAGGGGM